jgi:putative ABC transport system permease protein
VLLPQRSDSLPAWRVRCSLPGVLRSQLYGVRGHDPITLVAVPAILAFVALAASFLPTMRITRIQPAETLRME